MNIQECFKKKMDTEIYKFQKIINNWKNLLEFYYENLALNKQNKTKWLFRGDVFVHKEDSECSMEDAFKTSLDKAFEEYGIDAESPKQDTKRNKIEKAILRSFRRRAHLHTDDKDSTQTHLETFALLRHHGGPARILDWLYSFFSAVYFAVNRYDKNETYTVWALKNKWLNYVSEDVEDKFLSDKGYLKEHFNGKTKELKYRRKYQNNQFQSYVVTYLVNKNAKSLIYAANPYHLNERLAVQKGVLLFSGTVEKTWGENLQDIINNPPKNKGGKNIQVEGPILWEISIKLSKDCRNEFIRRLDEMNINQATLFPDLDGFAESLRTRIAHPESLGVEDS